MLGRKGNRIELLFNTRVVIAATLFLSSCTGLTAEELERYAAQKITCTQGDDCDVKWGRAITWIGKNSPWKIQTQNDSMIMTYPPTNESPASGFLVNKVPLKTGVYEITMSSRCGKLDGCIPNPTELKASFNWFVMGTAEGPRRSNKAY